MPGVVWVTLLTRWGVLFLFRPCFSFSFRCVCGGVGFGVFGYVGEGNVCPCQCVLCFSGWAAVWGLKINLYRLFLGWVSWCFGVCGGVLGAWVGWCGVCLAVFRGFWWWCGVCSWRGGFGGVSVCGGTYYLPLSVRYALWCRFLFLGVENQPLGVVFRVEVWVRARFGGLVTGCGCDKSPLMGGSGGVRPLCTCLYSCCLRTPVSGVVLVDSLCATCFLWYSYRVIMWRVIVTCYRFLFCSFGGIVSYGF